jgi:hypothetical protein
VRGAILILLGVAGFLGWRHFFPDPQTVIRQRLRDLAQAASFTPKESSLAKLSNTQRLMSFCTTDVEISIDSPNRGRQTMAGREELLQAALAVRNFLSSLTVEFVDINVTLGSDRKSAIAELTAKGKLPADNDMFVQELKFTLKKLDGDWLIRKIDTVKTLR